MPEPKNGEPTKFPSPPEAFQRNLADWSKQYQFYSGKTQGIQQQITLLTDEMNRLMPLAAKHEERVGHAIFTGTEGILLTGSLVTPEMKAAKKRIAELEPQLIVVNNQFVENFFFLNLYSIIPALINGKAVNSVDESLAAISTANVSPEVVKAAREQISALLSSRDKGTLPFGLPGIDEEPVVDSEIELPPLQPPTEKKIVPLSLHRLTIDALIKSLTTPKIPVTTMTKEEYSQFLAEKNYSAEDIDAETEITVEKLVAEAQNRKSMLDAYVTESARMPSRTLSDILKMTIVNPPLATLEALGIYYQHTSQPASGWLYGSPDLLAQQMRSIITLTGDESKFAKEGIPDVAAAVQQYINMHPEGGRMADAYAYAWNRWKAPGPPVLDFILKYMIMEGVVDPTNFLGWGYITKGLRALGPAGRVLAVGNVALGDVLEAPFDFAKWIGNSVIPKTIRQQATMFSRNSEQVIKVAFEKYHNGSIPLYQMNSKQLEEAGKFALAHLAKNPTADDDMALAAKELLVHVYVSKKDVTGWMTRLKRIGSEPMDEKRITPQTLKNLSDIFENVFNKKTTAVEEAGSLLKVLGVMDGSDDAYKLAERLLVDRANWIFDNALSFTAETNTRRALSALSNKQSKIYEAIVSNDVQKEAMKAGRFALFTYNIERKYVGSWAHYINRYVIRSAADTYLTFAGYGFGNAGEDLWRSLLGGVKPGRATIDDIDTAFIGLMSDPTLRVRGLSEMIGQLREVDEFAWHNWILTFSTLWAGVPTYLVSGGKVTPRQVGEKAMQFMVEMPGAFSADVRRNFVLGKFGQILAETGGDTYKALADLVPRKLPSELDGAQKWVKRNLIRDLDNLILSGKLTSDNIVAIERLKARYTVDKIVGAEIDDILTRYPEISPSSRSLTKSAYADHSLMKSSESIDAHMRLVDAEETDDFLRSPERAVENFDNLTTYLTSLEVKNPKDMAELITAIHRMTVTYSMLPDQVTARATIKSRGLPIDDRRLQFDTESDRIYSFLDKAGVDMDRVVDRISQTSKGLRYSPSIDWNTVSFVGIPDLALRANLRSIADKLPLEIKSNVRSIEISAEKIKRLTPGSGAHFNPNNGSIVIRDVKIASDPVTLEHELAHSWVYNKITNEGDTFLAEFADSILDLKSAKAISARRVDNPNVSYNEFKGVHEDFSVLFSSYIETPEKLTKRELAYFEKVLPKTLPSVKVPVTQQAATQRYLDLVTSAHKVVRDAKAQDIVFRQSFFADATQRDLRDNSFWNRFYASEMSYWKNVNKQIAVINSQLHQAIEDITTASGRRRPARPAIKVVGRPLAPADVAKLVGTRGDDLSRMLLDTLIPEGDKDYFVEYVSGLVRQGYDEGFDKASIGAIYDQIAASIQVDPNSASWFRIRQKQVESMGQDLHDLYNAKLLPKEQKEAIDKLIDETAKKADVILGSGIFNKEEWDKTRQSALDESLKWFYKEYVDYSHANGLDAIMTQLYPFWRYESQRWLWLPRSFIRHPGTLTTWGRWEDNTDYGYIHIPGTSIDINPARGTVYGPWSSRLLRRDYPEYYDELEGMGGLVGFFDFVSRYGFYPNVIFGALQAQYGGSTGQLGGILPSIASTPLNAMIAAFPDNKLVEFISERVFPEQFRQYLTARGVDDLGGDGSLLYAKRKAGQAITLEEEAMWAQARRSTALHSALFEQLGFARMKSDESYALAQASTAFIEEQWGYTADQQRQLRLRDEKIWDLIGGLDPWETAMLQELEFFKYSGSANPLLPSYKQAILNNIELDWADVMSYSEAQVVETQLLQQDFLVGSERGRLAPDDFLHRVRDLYRKRREYIDEKTKANPLMLLENRTDFYAKYKDPMPVQSPYNELMDLYFSIELEDAVDPGTGERTFDWDKYWANKGMIEDAIPEADKGKWDAFLSRHTIPIMQVWQDVYNTYFKKYYGLWDRILSAYSDTEQQLINEYLFLEKTGQQLDRQAIIKDTVSEKDGKQLISSFRSLVSDEREALRYANPHLDAWLFYWGRVKSFKTAKAEETYKRLAKQTGRRID